MYERILLAIDVMPTEENRSALTRTEQIGRMTGATVYVLHSARAHIVPGDIIAGSHFGVLSADDDVEAEAGGRPRGDGQAGTPAHLLGGTSKDRQAAHRFRS